MCGRAGEVQGIDVTETRVCVSWKLVEDYSCRRVAEDLSVFTPFRFSERRTVKSSAEKVFVAQGLFTHMAASLSYGSVA